MTKNVLVIDDSWDYQTKCAKEIHGDVAVMGAQTLRQGEEMFGKLVWDLIVMDGWIDSAGTIYDIPNSIPLLRKIRETFTGPIIAASGSPHARKKLMREGCDHEASKNEVPKKVMEILGLS